MNEKVTFADWLDDFHRLLRGQSYDRKRTLLRWAASKPLHERGTQSKEYLAVARNGFYKLCHVKGKFSYKSSDCFTCGAKGECRHHIVPLKYYGCNRPANIVILCDYCHGLIHQWLRDDRWYDEHYFRTGYIHGADKRQYTKKTPGT